ncbi:unnamed protein product [Orchesella dallaii]|uniref:Poly(A) RNA polymerase mitochondrial-like central palm domain-containing protein n=1 Tax=Orchesella dallaii TaxID=48710 RepID=A0ABP1S1E8_9HEXA
MKFCCEVCPGNTQLSSYSDWMKHLTGTKHQIELKKRHAPRTQWPNADSTYVLIGPVSEFSFVKLLEWIATFGVVTEFLYDNKHHFCIFTLQSVGNVGNAKAKEVCGDQVVNGKKVFIKPKSEFGPNDWNFMFETEESYDDKSVGSVASRSSSSVSSSRLSSKDATSTPKGTVVFTNKNWSSKLVDVKSPSAKALKPESGTGTTMKVEMDSIEGELLGMTLNATSHRKDNTKHVQEITPKVGKKKKSKRQSLKEIDPQILQKTAESRQTLYSEVPPTPPSASQPQKSDDNFPLLPTNVNNADDGSSTHQNHETFNFRGGFTYSRTLTSRMSESNDGHNQMQRVDTAGGTSAAETTNGKSASSSKSNSAQSLVEPLRQILQLHLVKASPAERATNGIDDNVKTRATDGSKITPAAKVVKRRVDSVSEISPSLKLKPFKQNPNAVVPRYVSNFLETISPILAAQVPDKIKNYIFHPDYPTTSTYRFAAHPQTANFFDLFNFLGMSNNNNNHKKQVHPKPEIFRRFTALQLSAQLQEFVAAQTLSFDDMRVRWQFVLDMHVVLRKHYPKCELYAFGSLLTGLGDISSDIDVYVDLTGEDGNPSNALSKRLSSQQALASVKNILSKSSCPHQRNRFVKNIIAVRSARIPIIKLTHATTNVNCDISFENRLSVQNTKLMSLCIKLDPRVFPLMVLIRFWGKYHQLTGSSLIKNYALMLLVLVYLVKAKVLPPIALLQRLKASERQRNGQTANPNEIEGWDASFCENISMIKSHFKALPVESSFTQNPAPTLIKMAQEFFELYGNTDLSSVVVCTLTGEILPKEDFLPGNEERLQARLDRYKTWAVQQERNKRLNIRNTYLCIQDPFLLSFNVGCVTPLGTLLRFQIGCIKTAEVLKNANNLNSLLDVFVRIPPHIGERKFMRVYKAGFKSEEIKKEIKLAFGANSEEETKLIQSKSSFVKLPKHLGMFEGLIDERDMKIAAKKPKWETFIDLSVDKDFESIFITEMTRCRIQEARIRMFEIMYSLWMVFAQEFLEEIFRSGLKLEVDKEDVSVEPPIDVSSSKEGKRTPNLKLLPQDMLPPPRKNPQQIDLLCKKIMELPIPSSQILYKRMHVNVKYPFWEKRMAHAKKVIEEMRETELIRVEIYSPPDYSSKKRSKIKDNAKNEPKVSYFSCLNPVSVEDKVSLKIMRDRISPDETFSPFTFAVLVKLDFMNSTSQRPTLAILLDEESHLGKDTMVRAFQTVASIITEAFPAYVTYRLAKWLELESVAEKEDVKSTAGQNLKEVNARTKEEKVGKRQVRSKLDEDLLIPSSDSSDDEENEMVNENEMIEENETDGEDEVVEEDKTSDENEMIEENETGDENE